MKEESAEPKGNGSRANMSEDRGWQSIGRALKVLDVIGAHQRAVSLTDISAEVRLTISTTHRILRGLEARDFVQRDPLTGDYSVGPSIMRLAQSALAQTADGDLALLALPRMQRLRETTKETVGFHVVNGLRRMCLAELPSHEPIRMASGVGASYVLGVGASGKAILAHLPDETVEQVVATKEFQTRSSIGTTVAAVQKALATVRRDGHAISFGETFSGASAIALPIVDARGYARASLNITGPETRWTKARMMQHLEEAREITDWIEKRLGRT